MCYWKLLKIEQIYPVYSVRINRAFEHIKLVVQSTDNKNSTHSFQQSSLG